MSYRIAVGSTDGEMVNLHFGHADRFWIYNVNEEDGSYELIEERKVAPACFSSGECGADSSSDPMEQAAELLSDVQYVLVSKIGPHAVKALSKKGVTSFSIVLPVDEAVEKINVYRKRQAKILARLESLSDDA